MRAELIGEARWVYINCRMKNFDVDDFTQIYKKTNKLHPKEGPAEAVLGAPGNKPDVVIMKLIKNMTVLNLFHVD